MSKFARWVAQQVCDAPGVEVIQLAPDLVSTAWYDVRWDGWRMNWHGLMPNGIYWRMDSPPLLYSFFEHNLNPVQTIDGYHMEAQAAFEEAKAEHA